MGCLYFWLPLAHFWLSLAHFWLPLAHIFPPFGSLFAPFGSLLLHFLTLGVSWRRFWSLSDFSNKNPMKKYVFLCFSPNFLLFTHPLPQSTCRLIEGTLHVHGARFSHTSIFSRPGAGNCRRQLRSAPGLLGSPRGVLAFDSSVSFTALFLFFCFSSFCLFSCSLPSLPKVRQAKKGPRNIR